MTQKDDRVWLINLLKGLPDQRQPDYETKVQELRVTAQRAVTELGRQLERRADEIGARDPDWSSGFELSSETLKEIADDETESVALRFNALFVCQTLLWRRYDYKEFRKNVRDYEVVFSDLPMFNHQQAMALLSRSDLPSLQEALRYTKDACAEMPSSPGVLNLLSEIVAELGEYYPHDIAPDDISSALEAIGRAIGINRKYGKYYSNRARLLALEDRYDEADRNVRIAIEVEPSSDSPIYALRISRYEFIRSRILNRRHQHDSLNEQRRVRDEVRQTRSETMLMLGLLAAVVGFIVTGFDIATSYEPLSAGAILGLLAGLLLVVFTGFGELVRFSRAAKIRTISVLLAGLTLIALSSAVLWRLSDV